MSNSINDESKDTKPKKSKTKPKKSNGKPKKNPLWNFFNKYTSQCIVIFSFIIVLIFTVITMFLNCYDIIISDVLIEYFYKFFGFELIALSGIKIAKHIGNAFGEVIDDIEDTISDDEIYG